MIYSHAAPTATPAASPIAAPLPAPAIFAAPRTLVSSIVGSSFLGETFSSTKLRFHKLVTPEIIKREKELNNRQGSNIQD